MVECPRIPVAYPDAAVPLAANRAVSGRVSKVHRHTDADWEICYVGTGEAEYQVGDGRRHMQAGDILIVRPDDPHGCLTWRGERYTVMFRETLLGAMPFVAKGTGSALSVDGFRLPVSFAILHPRRPTMTYLFDRLQQESFGNDATKCAMCSSLLAQFLLELRRSARNAAEPGEEPVSPVARRTVQRLCEEVRAALDEFWTLDDLVKRSGYSATQLSVLFNRVIGLSPCQWLSRERVQRACELLAESEKNATQIAQEVGFGSRSQFHRAFRRLVGTTPIRYQAIVRHEEKA